MSNCGCTELNTVPCTQTQGCTTTLYSGCVIYNGDALACLGISPSSSETTVTLNDVLEAICSSLSGAGTIDVSAWNFGCYPATSTIQQFAETTASKVCTLETDLAAIETPSFTRCSLFLAGDYQIIIGTTTIQKILEFYGEIICEHDNELNVSVTNNCFTSTAGLSTLSQYLQWIINNTCTITGNLSTRVTATESSITTINAYLGGYTAHNNTDCLGGTAADGAYETIQLLKTKVCALNTTVTALPNFTSYSLVWPACFGYSTVTTLATHLSRIVTELTNNRLTFSSDFVVTPAACGNTISLAPSAFACSQLNSCSIQNLGNVSDTVLANVGSDIGKYIYWTGTEFAFRQLEVSVDSRSLALTTVDNATELSYKLGISFTSDTPTYDAAAAYPVTVDITLDGVTDGLYHVEVTLGEELRVDNFSAVYSYNTNVTTSSTYTPSNQKAVLFNNVVTLGGVIYLNGYSFVGTNWNDLFTIPTASHRPGLTKYFELTYIPDAPVTVAGVDYYSLTFPARITSAGLVSVFSTLPLTIVAAQGHFFLEGKSFML